MLGREDAWDAANEQFKKHRALAASSTVGSVMLETFSFIGLLVALSGILASMFGDNSFSFAVVALSYPSQFRCKSLIASILNFLGLLSILLCNFSFWFTCRVNQMCASGIDDFTAVTISHPPGTFII